MMSTPDSDRFADQDLTGDDFLGGRVTALQPGRGFRSSTDAVFLAASVPARPGQQVLELGAGAGVVSLCLAARVPGIRGVAVEVQPAYADLAQRNFVAAGLALEVSQADVSALPDDIRQQRFDHVYFNPPYFPPGSRGAAMDAGREIALGERTPLSVWVDAAIRRLAPGGSLTLIHRADRLAEILSSMDRRVGAIRVLPLAARVGSDANRVLVQARAGRKDPLKLMAPLIVHSGAKHESDGNDYSPEATVILAGPGATLLGRFP